MYRLTVSAGQIVDFDIDTAANGSGGLGSFLRLFDGQGLQLAFNNDAAAPGESTVGFDAYLRFTFSNAGTYFIGVSNSNNIQYNPLTGGGDASGGPNSTGSYQLSVQLISTGPEDPDDSIGDALLLGALTTTAVSVSGSISPDTDVDMYRFTLADAVTVDFDIDTTFSAASLGSYIRIFDAQGQQLAFNNDGTAPGESNAGFDSYLRYSFASPGTYYIGVSNAVNILYNPITGGDDIAGGTRSTGDYSLFAQVVLVAAQDPDDSLSESTTIGPISSSPTSVSGDVSPATDVDLYRFVVSAGQTIDFDVDTLTNGGSGLGSYLRLFNGQGQQLAFNDNGAAPGESQTGIDAYLRYTFTAAGTFYLGISNGNNTQYNPVDGSGDTDGGSNSTGNYTLVVQLIPAGGDLDDTLSEAAVIGGLSTNPTILNASISPDIDVDMFQFAASIGQTLEFDIDTALNGPGGLSSFLRLFDANGQQIGFGGPASAPGEGQANFDAFLRHTFSASGTYFIGVSNGNNTLYDPLSGTGDTAGGANATGNYSLIVQVSSVVEGDPDDTLTEAIVLGAVGSNPINLNGTISTDIDVDLVQFTVFAGQVVDFDIDTTQNGTGGLASYIRLLDAQGQQIAFNDNARAPGESTLGSDAYLRYTFTAAGTYYLGISNATNFQYNPINGEGDIGGGVDATGSYQLTVTALPATLSILSSVFSIPERNGEAIVQVVRTNTSLATAVTVQLSSSNTQVATVPASVVIPAGQSFAAFRITAVDNLIVDGSKSVTITAAAADLLSTSIQLTITDSNGLWHNAASPTMSAMTATSPHWMCLLSSTI